MNSKNTGKQFNILLIGLFIIGVLTNKFEADDKGVQQNDLITENLILISLDGLRWQELFYGADSLLISHEDYVRNPDQLTAEFWDEDYRVRRSKLLPFIWDVIEHEGRIYGNRNLENKIDLTNEYRFSYPGYSELLAGYADPEVNSNAREWNQNLTVLEFVNNQAGFEGKVAAFASWDVFPYIINSDRSGIPVNAGFEPVEDSNLTEREILLNEMITQVPRPWQAVRYNAFTFHYAMEYLRKHQPRLLYLAFDETDEFAHSGDYENYLYSARQVDAFISELWNFVQSDPIYQGKTTFLIATDHGRGTEPVDQWRHHGASIDGAEEVWLAVIGPDTSADGEMKGSQQFYQDQIAATIAAFLGLNFSSEAATGDIIHELLQD
jgi:hypothetical protein